MNWEGLVIKPVTVSLKLKVCATKLQKWGLAILNRTTPVGDWNQTNIALILKVNNLRSVSDFCPINLFNLFINWCLRL